jgi:hypothetical protein
MGHAVVAALKSISLPCMSLPFRHPDQYVIAGAHYDSRTRDINDINGRCRRRSATTFSADPLQEHQYSLVDTILFSSFVCCEDFSHFATGPLSFDVPRRSLVALKRVNFSQMALPTVKIPLRPGSVAKRGSSTESG